MAINRAKLTKRLVQPEFTIVREPSRCIQCQVCARQCANECHAYDEESNQVLSYEDTCVGCQRCVTLCPTNALTVKKTPPEYAPDENWSAEAIQNIYRQAESGGVLLAAMGNDQQEKVYWDHMLLNASQVTNPSIDPLREPMELTTYLGRKPDSWSWTSAAIPPR
jgi:NAD-dependent dihydropyrimidine dehydrogenase PreA subunit